MLKPNQRGSFERRIIRKQHDSSSVIFYLLIGVPNYMVSLPSREVTSPLILPTTGLAQRHAFLRIAFDRCVALYKSVVKGRDVA
jgi:hypothetical protein